jgi:hypothetical protein
METLRAMISAFRQLSESCAIRAALARTASTLAARSEPSAILIMSLKKDGVVQNLQSSNNSRSSNNGARVFSSRNA